MSILLKGKEKVKLQKSQDESNALDDIMVSMSRESVKIIISADWFKVFINSFMFNLIVMQLFVVSSKNFEFVTYVLLWVLIKKKSADKKNREKKEGNCYFHKEN